MTAFIIVLILSMAAGCGIGGGGLLVVYMTLALSFEQNAGSSDESAVVYRLGSVLCCSSDEGQGSAADEGNTFLLTCRFSGRASRDFSARTFQ